MPQWAKILLIIVGVSFIILGVAGYLGAMALKNGIEHFEEETRRAQADGEMFGLTATLEGCAEETVYRVESCEGSKLICGPSSSTFIWACLESATFDRHFCAGLPRAGEDDAIMAWAEAACGKYGQSENEFCSTILAVVPGFCEIQRR